MGGVEFGKEMWVKFVTSFAVLRLVTDIGFQFQLKHLRRRLKVVIVDVRRDRERERDRCRLSFDAKALLKMDQFR